MGLQVAARVVVVVAGGTAILYFGRPVLVPLAIAAVMAMVLNPLLNWLLARGVGRRWSIALCMLTLLACAALVVGVLVMQIAQVAQDWPQIQQAMKGLIDRGQAVVAERSGMAPEAVSARVQSLFSGAARFATTFFGTLVGGLALAVLTFVYIILLLAERERLAGFVMRRVPPARRRDAEDAMHEAANVAYHYLTGKLKVMGIMAALYSAAFLLAGVQYGVFLALTIAMSSIVPYLGNLVIGLLAVLLALVSSGGTAALVVLVVLLLAQIGENYLLEPLVVGRNVDLSPLVTVFSVVALGALWGVAGAVLALPMAAIIRVVSAHVPRGKPMAALMKAEK